MRHDFTDRQAEVVRLIARGLSDKEVADKLGVTHSTAKKHAERLRFKLDVEKRRQIPQAYMRVTGDNPYPTEVAA